MISFILNIVPLSANKLYISSSLAAFNELIIVLFNSLLLITEQSALFSIKNLMFPYNTLFKV